MSHFMYHTNGGKHGGGGGMVSDGGPGGLEYQYLAQMKAFINKAYKAGKYCDLTLKTKDGVALHAHKLILASQCKYFMQKLDAEPDSCELKIDVRSEALKVIIDYIYTQKIRSGSITADNARDVLKACDMFKLDDLKEEAAIVMAKNLNEEIAVDIMTDNIFAGAVADNAFTFTANNFQLFLNKDHLKKRIISEIKPGLLGHLLNQKNLMLWDKDGVYLDAVEREKQLFFFLLSYISHDLDNRFDHFKPILMSLRLPLLIHHKILNLSMIGAGLKKPPEVLAGLLSDVLDPYEKLTGEDNLVTFFAKNKTDMGQTQRKKFAETCRMRYATLPHTCVCSDVSRSDQPWAEKITFCPAGNNSNQTCYSTKHVIKSITVSRGKAGDPEDDSKQLSRRVRSVTMKYSDDSEQSVGDASDDDTVKQETYQLEEGELVTEVHYHYPVHVMEKRGGRFQSDVFSLTNVHDVSFLTNKQRRLGPGQDTALEDGLTLKIPAKIRQLEKNCPGSCSWLQGFGSETVKLGADEEELRSLFPVWGFKAHFKVYSVKKQEFKFVPGYKKHYQFSLDGLSENPVLDDLEDLHQLEKSPVHEVVDIDSEDEESESEEEDGAGYQQGTINAGEDGDDSIMVVDSDDDDEEESEGDYRQPPVHRGFGGADEPIEIESSSEEESEEPVNEDKKDDEEESVNNDEKKDETAEKRKRSESNDDDSEESVAKSAKEADDDDDD